MMLRSAYLACLALGTLVSCSSSTSGGFMPPMDSGPMDSGPVTTFTGTVNGKSFAVANAVALKGVAGTAPEAVTIIIGNAPDMCELAPAYYSPQFSRQGLLMIIMTLTGNTPKSPVMPGDYSPPNLMAEFVTYDDKCNPTTGQATTASVMLTGTGNWYEGGFSLIFPGGSAITGNFQAPLCKPPKMAGKLCQPL